MADMKRRGFLGMLAGGAVAAPMLPALIAAPVKSAAVASADGAITAVTITNSGAGYSTPPMFQFVGEQLIGRTMKIRLPNG